MPLYFSKLSLKAPELLKIIHINKHVNNITSERQNYINTNHFSLSCSVKTL